MQGAPRLAALLLILLVPGASLGATLAADDSVNVSVSPTDNAYLAGTEVRVNAALPADLLVAAGTLLLTAPVAGDALVAAGTVDLAAPVAGDVRAAGGRVVIEGDVGGDVAVLGGVVSITGRGKEVRAAGGTVEITKGAAGPVTVYGGSVYLSGEFAGDVSVVASDHITLGEGTVIAGVFEYNAPQEASIPGSAVITGGIRYTGSAAFLPTAEEAKTFALAGVGVFLVVRLVALMLAAGLLAGLFPVFSRRLAEETLTHSWKRFVLLMLLGFALMVATPVLIILLLATFVGIGIALLVGAAYLLALLMAYLFAALLAGALVMRFFAKRLSVSWKSAILGTLILYLLGFIPGVGFFFGFILAAASLGALGLLFFRFAFGRAGLE